MEKNLLIAGEGELASLEVDRSCVNKSINDKPPESVLDNMKEENFDHSNFAEEKAWEPADEKQPNRESSNNRSRFDEQQDIAGESSRPYDGDEEDESVGQDEDSDDYNDDKREGAENNMDNQQLEESLWEAKLLKDEGNAFYRTNEFPKAVICYSNAIKTCPVKNKNDRAIYFSNRAACYVKMENYKKAIKDGSKALDLNPGYLKARLRRAQCYEHEERLEEALEDYQKVFESDRSNNVAREAVQRLPDQIKEKHEKLKEEMFGKLKDLGNLVLKPFGLSTDNFQMQQDPNTGGYSINFKK